MIPVDQIVLRVPSLDDAETAVAAINAASWALRGHDEVTVRDIRGWWTQPAPFDLEADVVLAVDDGVVVGYGDLVDQAHDGMVMWLDVRGETLEAVLGELERRALERLAPGGVVRAVSDHLDTRYAAVLTQRGYVRVRSTYRMGIDLADGTFAPGWPADAAVRTAVEGVDEPLLHRICDAAVADHWGYTPLPYAEWLHGVREVGSVDPTLRFVVERGGVPVGVALCRPDHAGDAGCGWVSQLAVLREHRGHGLGSALLVHCLAVFQERGLPRAGLGVDAENTTGAVRLYERAGMRIAELHDTWELRP